MPVAATCTQSDRYPWAAPQNSTLECQVPRVQNKMQFQQQQLMRAHMDRWQSTLCLLGLLLGFGRIAEARTVVCNANSAALEALDSKQNFTVEKIESVGYGFYFENPTLSQLTGGPNVSRGLVFLPEDDVDPAAYAPYARAMALVGYYAVILNAATPGRVLEAMMLHPELVFWCMVGHGTGGQLAARIAVTLQPKVKSVVLLASALPPDVDLRSLNVFLTVIYGDNDAITTPADIANSFLRVRGDTSVLQIPGFGHFDFAYSTCVGNAKAPSNVPAGVTNRNTSIATINLALFYSIEFAQWAAGTKKALSYGDNHFLTPGFNDSKPYPGDIRVRVDELPIPGTFPQRTWWVFTPSRIKGGIVFYPGAAVDGTAYFPLAFEIAARGHLVVIVQQPSRNAITTFQDANTVIDSNLTIFSGVPKGRWAISGHSLGGAAAISYLACFGNKIYAAVVYAGSWVLNTNTSEVPILDIYGSLDVVGGGSNSYFANSQGLFNPNKTTFLVVEGANHYQVGDYGYQVPDQIPTISLEEQHAYFAWQTVSFLDGLETTVYAPVTVGQACSSQALIGRQSLADVDLTHTIL